MVMYLYYDSDTKNMSCRFCAGLFDKVQSDNGVSPLFFVLLLVGGWFR